MRSQEGTKPVEIIYHYHSCFEIRTSKGVIVIDPHQIEAYGPPEKVKADIVLMTHNHPDHNQLNMIENKASAKVIRGFKGTGSNQKWNLIDEKVNGVRIRTVGTYHDDVKGMQYGINTIFIIEVDGWKIAHLGDLGHTLALKQAKEIGQVDVLMLPVGGIYSLNGSEAARVVKQLKPKEYIFPMHYATPVSNEILPPDEFLESFPKKQIARDKSHKLTLNRDPERPRPLVVLLAQDK